MRGAGNGGKLVCHDFEISVRCVEPDLTRPWDRGTEKGGSRCEERWIGMRKADRRSEGTKRLRNIVEGAAARNEASVSRHEMKRACPRAIDNYSSSANIKQFVTPARTDLT